MSRYSTFMMLLIAVASISFGIGTVIAGNPSDGTQVSRAALGTGFTYQGILNEGTARANGVFDFRFTLYDAETNGSQIGQASTFALQVFDSLFTAELDFGPSAFDGSSRWLEIEVKPSGETEFTKLSPRQAVRPSPYALYASDGPFWSMTGNSSTTPGVNFVGTKDDRELVFKTNGLEVMRLATNGWVGIGPVPGEKLHLTDGNFLIEGGGETAIKIKRDKTFTGGPSGTSTNPIFELGRIIAAGDGDPEFRFLYADDQNPTGRSVFEFDRKGIVASVKQDRGSHFEGFKVGGDEQPVFRLNSYPEMRLEMGSGGASTTPVDVAIVREATSTLTFITGDVEKVTNQNRRVTINDDGMQVKKYLKLDSVTGVPPSEDCSGSTIGRMKVDNAADKLYVCFASGWKAIQP